MKKLACAIAVAGLIGTPAFAADLNKPAYKAQPPAPVAPVFNWTGFYIGGNIGWVQQHEGGTSNFTSDGSTPLNESFSDDGAIGGFQLGYNWQFAPNWVLGIEGDWQWTHEDYSFCRQTDFIPGGVCADAGANDRGILTVSSSTDWIATLRGRLGFTWDRFFLYGTGGGAWGKVNTTLTASCTVDGCGPSSAANLSGTGFSNTQGGWVAGVGVEAFVYGNWTAKVEYLHIDLGNVTNSFTSAPAFGPYTVSWSRDVRFDTVRFGLNYKFTGLSF